NAQFAGDDLRQRRLAQSGRADEENMIERFLARARRLDEHAEIGARFFLADELRQALRAQAGVDVVVALVGGHKARVGAHVMPRRYLFGSSDAMVLIFGPRPPGTITFAFAS